MSETETYEALRERCIRNGNGFLEAADFEPIGSDAGKRCAFCPDPSVIRCFGFRACEFHASHGED